MDHRLHSIKDLRDAKSVGLMIPIIDYVVYEIAITSCNVCGKLDTKFAPGKVLSTAKL